ncbi:hypothetical protein [Fontivita pretiosa]|uniref:hypothetical protein n=1 Tax=Fontivita pretiosa TaxID=2989684 RepID=UPI003D175F92
MSQQRQILTLMRLRHNLCTGLMDRVAHICLLLWVCLWAGLLPLVGGTVVCNGSDGHRAVEPAHPFTDCPEIPTTDSDGFSERSKQRCVDVPLANLDLARPQSRPGVLLDRLLPGFTLSVVPIEHGGQLGLWTLHAVCGQSPPSLLDRAARLATVILLN